MSDFLFARPSFWAGFGRSIDLAGMFDEYNSSPTPEVADARAIRSDFNTVGRDLVAMTESATAERE